MIGRLAQLVEHLVYTERVSGSSPLAPTMASDTSRYCLTFCQNYLGVYASSRLFDRRNREVIAIMRFWKIPLYAGAAMLGFMAAPAMAYTGESVADCGGRDTDDQTHRPGKRKAVPVKPVRKNGRKKEHCRTCRILM